MRQPSPKLRTKLTAGMLVAVMVGVASPAFAQMEEPIIGGLAGAVGGGLLGRMIAGKHNNTKTILGTSVLGGLAGGALGYGYSKSQRHSRSVASPAAYPQAAPPPVVLQDQWQRSNAYAASGGPINTADQVTSAQRMLRAVNIYQGPVDGVLGPTTRNAVIRYQADIGLPQTGDITPALLDHLRSSM
jgi:hypothetical protein